MYDEARFKGYVQPSSLKPEKGGGASIRLVIEVPRVHEQQADLAAYTRMMAEGSEVEVLVRPALMQGSLFTQDLPAEELTVERDPKGDGPPALGSTRDELADDLEVVQHGQPLRKGYTPPWAESEGAGKPAQEEEPAEELVSAPPEGLRLLLVEEEWQGTETPLYEVEGDYSADDLADYAFSRHMDRSVIRLVKQVARSDGRRYTQTLLYLWDPETRKLRRIPQHQVKRVAEQLSA